MNGPFKSAGISICICVAGAMLSASLFVNYDSASAGQPRAMPEWPESLSARKTTTEHEIEDTGVSSHDASFLSKSGSRDDRSGAGDLLDAGTNEEESDSVSGQPGFAHPAWNPAKQPLAPEGPTIRNAPGVNRIEQPDGRVDGRGTVARFDADSRSESEGVSYRSGRMSDFGSPDDQLPSERRSLAEPLLRIEAGADGRPATETDVQAQAGKGRQADAIIRGDVELLVETGLIARQSAIAESIIIMERQLQQAELIRKLIEVLGPDAAIEVAPGQFATFGDTPVGKRVASRIAEEELQARIRLLELEIRETALRDAIETGSKTSPTIDLVALPAIHEDNPHVPELLEIHGLGGVFGAVLDYGGDLQTVTVGDALPDGSNVDSISDDGVVLNRSGILQEFRIDE